MSSSRVLFRRRAAVQAQGRPPRRGRTFLTAIFCLIVCGLLVDALVGDQGLVARMRARRQYERLAADLARLRAENAALRDQARRLREDPAMIEEVARRELGLMSPGERLFIIKDVGDASRLPPPQR